MNDSLCGPCARAAGFRKPIPEGFYEDADLRAALANYDFGAVFAAVRQQTGLSQLQLADLLGLSQSRVSAVPSRHLRGAAAGPVPRFGRSPT
ncbi:helix-turn-helix domain-containing protein [Saccharopolyspora phatthalungensis]|uniref:Ribosome-binding protein aMBF1 (Putative translation factor) n=1 Tax=Saccharopolyspora phatthalungensis TaxID=664693 RepID=A0A840QK27_9PSEU|nr:helix-turn-helix transcriptional regulator [Saccharopolyspora phatthalungensis]MBB5159545.1 ribosome-binding protein aMBF1 (putative translation factor) [Saccharopolyspora phatthalungensis]